MTISGALKISVVTPMYNALPYIEQAVRSVQAQTFKDFEYIIVDDGSTDGSREVVERLASEDYRIRVVSLEKNMGNSTATNRAFAEARGKYIALMDADDICHPDRLKKEAEYLDANQNTGIVGAQYWRMDSSGKVLRKTRSAHGDVTILFKLFFSVPMCNPTQMFRRELLADLGPDFYDPALVGAADYDFFLRASRKWKIHVLRDYLFYYRIHPESLSKSKIDTVMKETMDLAWKRIVETFPALAERRNCIETFIRCHRDTRTPVTGRTLGLFLEGLDCLARAYLDTCRTWPERREVRRFVAELEVKTLLGRQKIYKTPTLLFRWLGSVRRNHVFWALI
ncbi:MAG: glycosyltransferase [Alphaproteobacteria bacterium]|nr:glycosyltransferase [Alphaproteobacteria bacterium]